MQNESREGGARTVQGVAREGVPPQKPRARTRDAQRGLRLHHQASDAQAVKQLEGQVAAPARLRVINDNNHHKPCSTGINRMIVSNPQINPTNQSDDRVDPTNQSYESIG